MNTSEQINELAAALAKAQAQIQPAKKENVNPAFKSKYADLASVWDACREPLTANGLAVVQMPTDCAEAGRVALVTTLLHSSGQWISSMVSTRIVKDDPQGVGSALTYLRRYALSAMVGVAPDDDDGNAASQRSPRDEPARAVPPVAPETIPATEATDAQIKAIFGIGKALGYTKDVLDEIAQRYGATKVGALTKEQARLVIEQLKDWQAEDEAHKAAKPALLSDEYDQIEDTARKDGAFKAIAK